MLKGIDSVMAIDGLVTGSSFIAPVWGVFTLAVQPTEFDIESICFADRNNASVKTDLLGSDPSDFAEEFIYERTWITPVAIAFGTLLATHIETINFWNAYRDRSVILESITGYDDYAGTSIDASSLPDTFTPTADGTYILTVTMSGPPQLDCYYLFVNDSPSASNQLDLTGTRVLFLPFRHNWDKPYKVKYEAETVISTTKKLCEQRHPVFANLKREIVATDLFPSGIKIRNYLKAYLHYAITIPIVTEAMTINLTGSLNGLLTLPINETISGFWNLAQSTHVVLWNTATDATEVCTLSSYTTSLVLEAAILNTWDAEDVIIYPIMFCILANLNISSITDLVDEINITAKEFPIYV